MSIAGVHHHNPHPQHQASTGTTTTDQNNNPDKLSPVAPSTSMDWNEVP